MSDEEIYQKVTTEISSYESQNPASLEFYHLKPNVVAIKTFDAQMNTIEWRFQFNIDVQIIRAVVATATDTPDGDWFSLTFSHNSFLSWDSWDVRDNDYCQKLQTYITTIENKVDSFMDEQEQAGKIIAPDIDTVSEESTPEELIPKVDGNSWS